MSKDGIHTSNPAGEVFCRAARESAVTLEGNTQASTNWVKSFLLMPILPMESKLEESDLGIIYDVGYGSLPPSHNDLTLAVYDRPVENDERIRFTDIIGLLEVKQWRPTVKEIPHYIIVLETCYSGNVILPDNWLMSTINNFHRVARVEGGLISSVPPQIVIITATPPGIDTRAYDLRGANVSAFGYFFARALGEDWDCVDTNPDGILTVNEPGSLFLERSEALKSAVSTETGGEANNP